VTMSGRLRVVITTLTRGCSFIDLLGPTTLLRN
jgi:hypothetical protein